jgi:peptidoglycan/xylan/chitin deacetylase (PgdA/CDA1 family)
VWRVFDPAVPRSLAFRRLRAVGLLAASVLLVTTATGALPLGSLGGGAGSEGEGPPASSAPPTLSGVAVLPRADTPGAAPVVTRVDTDDPVVFLTIDDGVSRTAEVADALADLGAPATLFLLDQPITLDAPFFRDLPGTLVEAHTRSHTDLRGQPQEEQQAEICGNADTIAAAFGRRPTLFRPPYGHYDDATLRAAAACGMAAVVLWQAVVEEGQMSFRDGDVGLQRGDIVLLHLEPGLRRDLRALADQAAGAGLQIALLEDYIGR